jgi:hypothetical protein
LNTVRSTSAVLCYVAQLNLLAQFRELTQLCILVSLATIVPRPTIRLQGLPNQFSISGKIHFVFTSVLLACNKSITTFQGRVFSRPFALAIATIFSTRLCASFVTLGNRERQSWFCIRGEITMRNYCQTSGRAPQNSECSLAAQWNS